MIPSRKTALIAGAAGAGALLVRRRAARSDDGASRPSPGAFSPPAGRTRTVHTEDGVDLAVTEHGAHGDPVATVVLAHGYVQSSALWGGQVHDLLEARPDLRVVTYDHRGHGGSGRTPRDRATLEQLGRDLAHVVDAVAPSGPVVVVGHSMGGMTIMAFAEQHPEAFGERVVGAGFVATSAAGMGELTYGLPRPVARVVTRLLPLLNEQAVRAEQAGKPRKVGPFDARMMFPKDVDPALVRQALDVHLGTPAETVAAFLPTFSDHDRLQVLESLSHVPSVVVVGDKDRICPLSHSRAISDALPQSELIVFPGVGHMVHLERRAEVSRALLGLVDRAVAGPRRSLSVA